MFASYRTYLLTGIIFLWGSLSATQVWIHNRSGKKMEFALLYGNKEEARGIVQCRVTVENLLTINPGEALQAVPEKYDNKVYDQLQRIYLQGPFKEVYSVTPATKGKDILLIFRGRDNFDIIPFAEKKMPPGAGMMP